jgi:uncharacterized protein (TIGR02246 family)
MRIRLYGLLALPAAALLLSAAPVSAQPPKVNKQEGDAIFKNAQAFAEAFEKGNAKALAAFWVADGDYTDQRGRHLKGRAAIEKALAEFFAENKGLKLRINSEALKFLTPDVAVEDGVTEVIPPDGAPPSRARYTIVHVKESGRWRLGSVRDSPFVPPTNYNNLKGLEWAVGDWADESGKGDVARVSFAWSENQGFLVSHFTTTFKNVAIGGGTQWIGWDPRAKELRSWTFDTDGGFGEGAWANEGNGKWAIKTKLVLPDGKQVAATNVVTRVDADTFTWQSRDRSVDGNALPDTKEIRMKRVK